MEANPELIADHYTQAGLDEEAVEFWREAGDLAMARSAPREAVAHLGEALALLERFPASLHRSRTELGLQTTLGAALVAARGFAAQEVGDAYARAQELCQEIGDDTRCFPRCSAAGSSSSRAPRRARRSRSPTRCCGSPGSGATAASS